MTNEELGRRIVGPNLSVGYSAEHFALIGANARSLINPLFQAEVDRWIQECFGPEIGADKVERNHRFLEEALETVQAAGCTISEAYQLVDYVFNRPVGELPQEIGGVMNTLAALCNAHGLDMMECGETEMQRVWTMVEKIRAKQAAKPKHSPLPAHQLDRETEDAARLMASELCLRTARREGFEKAREMAMHRAARVENYALVDAIRSLEMPDE